MPINIRRIALSAVLAGVCVASAAEPPRKIEGWGVVDDPMIYSKIDLVKDTLVMKPDDDYCDNYGSKVNAPSVMQDVTGDFTVEVNVVDLEKTVPNSVHESLNFPTAYHSGTLLIRHDKKNFVRFERVSMNSKGNENNHCALHIYKDQQREALKTQPIDFAPTQLRLERRDKRLLASVSQDNGKTWKEFPPQDIAYLPDTVKVGVSLTSNTQIGGTVKFRHLKITKVEKK